MFTRRAGPPPTPKDLVRGRGLLWFEDVLATVERRLEAQGSRSRAALALWCADRALAVSPPEGLGDAPAAALASPVLRDAMWTDVSQGAFDAADRVGETLRRIEEADYQVDQDAGQSVGQDGVDATIYAAQCYLSGDIEPARWAATLWIDAVFAAVGFDGPLDEEASHPTVQRALQQLLDALTYLERPDADPGALRTGTI